MSNDDAFDKSDGKLQETRDYVESMIKQRIEAISFERVLAIYREIMQESIRR